MNIRKVLIVGSGTLGQQIGFQCAMHGFDVAMYDLSEKSLDLCRASQRQYADMFVNERGRSRAEFDAVLARIAYTTNLAEAARDADLLSESVPETPKSSVRSIRCCTRHAPRRPSSPPTPQRCCRASSRTRPGGPSVSSPCTSPTRSGIAMSAKSWAIRAPTLRCSSACCSSRREIGMVPIRLDKEQNGYVLNTMLVTWLLAAQSLVTNGVARPRRRRPHLDDHHEDGARSVRRARHRRPRSFQNIAVYWGEAKDDAQLRKDAAFLKERFVDTGNLGVKTGAGYYPLSASGVRAAGLPGLTNNPSAPHPPSRWGGNGARAA